MVTVNRILALMDEHGVKAAQLTRALSLSHGVVTQWKQGQQKPSTEAIMKIADYFNVTTDFLLGRSEKQKEPQPLDKVLAHYALGACFSSPAFYEAEQIPVEAPRHQVKWPKAIRSIERKSGGKLSLDRLNGFLKISVGYTHFEDSEYPTLEEYAVLRKLAGKIERFDTMGGVARDELADEFLEHLKNIERQTLKSDDIKVAALIDELGTAIEKRTGEKSSS